MTGGIEEFAQLIPDSLLDISGKVFISGRDAFGSSSKLYILGLNPGGAPESNALETVGAHTRKVIHDAPDNWCALTDEAWGRNGHRVQHPMQRNVLHLLRRLDLDCRKVPASDLVFARSRDAAKISKAEFVRLANDCWPFHRAVIRRLEVRVIVCLGREAAWGAIARLEADNPAAGKFAEIDRFVEDRGLKGVSRAYRNGGGITVVQLTHPSRFHWTTSKSDPTELVRRALEFSDANPI